MYLYLVVVLIRLRSLRNYSKINKQLQQQAVIKKAEAAEAIKNAKKYDKLMNKYETLVQKQVVVLIL